MERLGKIFVWAIVGFIFVFGMLQAYEFSQGFSEMKKHGARLTHVRLHLPDSVLVFNSVIQLDFPDSTYPSIGDTIIAINDTIASDELWSAHFRKPMPAGHEVMITYKHRGDTLSAPLRLREFGREDHHYFFIMISAFLLAGILYFAIGILVIVKQGNASDARILALLTLVLTMFFFMVIPNLCYGQSGDVFRPSSLNLVLIDIVRLIVLFITGIWFHLCMIFPAPVRLVKNRPWLIYLLSYGLIIPMLIHRLTLPESVLDFPQVSSPELTISLYSIYSRVIRFGHLLGGFIILWRKVKTSSTLLEKRQVKSVVFGFGLGLLTLIFAGVTIAFISARLESMLWLMAALVVMIVLGLLWIPISFLYSIQKYGLMELGLKIRKRTRFLVVTLLLIVVFGVVLLTVSGIVVKQLGIESRTPTLIVAMVMVFGFIPVQRWVQRQVERRFYPERHRLRSMLKEVIEESAAMPDRATMWNRLEEGVKEGLKVRAFLPIWVDKKESRFCLTDGENVPFDLDGSLVNTLKRGLHPMVIDEALASDKVQFSDEEKQWINDHRIGILLPMLVHSNLTGLVAIAFQEGKEDIAAEDLGVLMSLVSQVALQSENLRLLEENIDKQRLEEQLGLARQVQEGFLPKQLPETPGVEIAAKLIPSFEVAGDYYDVVKLDNDCTLFAIGDVSGKGAGAAMIMANLQSLLRALSGTEVDLSKTVSQINNVICQNTSEAQYVTFWVSIYNPKTKTLTSVNAGHNQPRLTLGGDKIHELSIGGPIVGVLPGIPYEIETVHMESGDVLVAFTDGVSEAMNDKDEEFGEPRIVDIIRAADDKAPDKMIELVEKEVISFCGTRPLGDDFTLMIIKVI